MSSLSPPPFQADIITNGRLNQSWAGWLRDLYARVGGALSQRSHVSSPGYQKLPSGIFVQWGVTSAVASAGTESITLPITMPNNLFQAFASVRDNSAVATSATGQWGTGNYATTGFDIYNRTSVSLTFNWLALGD